MNSKYISSPVADYIRLFVETKVLFHPSVVANSYQVFIKVTIQKFDPRISIYRPVSRPYDTENARNGRWHGHGPCCWLGTPLNAVLGIQCKKYPANRKMPFSRTYLQGSVIDKRASPDGGLSGKDFIHLTAQYLQVENQSVT